MTFWKITDTRMNCLISQAEIEALGYSILELTQNQQRIEQFLNLILKKGKEVLGLHTENGIQSFYGALLPDQSLLLSISCGDTETELSEAEDDIQGLFLPDIEEDKESLDYQILFETLDHVIQFCEILGMRDHLESSLYKDKGIYYLFLSLPNTEEGRRFAGALVSAEEFGGYVEPGMVSLGYLKEHNKCLIETKALELLANMAQ